MICLAFCLLMACAAAVPVSESTWSPVEPTGPRDTLAPAVPTMPPKTGPCVPAGHLHMDFGGDIANFGDTQQHTLNDKLQAELGLKPGELQITRHLADENN